jgi:geranylgeranyl diphosphate synthase type II
MTQRSAGPESDPRDEFASRLAEYRDLVLPTLKAALPDREPRRHLYDMVAAHFARTGKGLRPALCLATCRAFGGRTEDALNSAAALELLHNAFLVHDDVEDGSEFRRDQPTMHTQYGIPLAVNTGDAMNALSLRILRDNLPVLGGRKTWRVLQEFDHMLIESLEGQAMELGWIRDNDCSVTASGYLLMTLKKTCWYSFIHPCRIGALIARDDVDLDAFNRFGFFIGAAFQIQDDVLNLIGDAHKYGKEIGGDLWEGKRTLILSHLFGQLNDLEMERAKHLLAKPRSQRLRRDIEWLAGEVRARGSIDFARGASRDLSAAAAREFEAAYASAAEGEDKAFIRSLVDFVVRREL